jgi:medium-chain acyl-[acyl-carrier-protein] hydrolase
MSLKYAEKKRITCYEADSTGKMLPTSAMNYFQEASTNQGIELGVGGDFLKEKGLAWFLVKYVIRFNTYPLYQDLVTVTTQATGMEKFCATRRFTLEDETGETKVVADTQWLLINRETEKMERIDEYPHFDVYQCQDKGEPLFKKIQKITRVDVEKQFHVRFLDIDFNKHVNHVKYLAWAIELLPLETVKTKVLKSAKLVYKAQCFYGDQIRAIGQQFEENEYRIDIVNQENDVLCQLELTLA